MYFYATTSVLRKKIVNDFCKVFPKNFASQVSNNEIRVRFAPSPTGFLHLGGLRTAFYNFLFAKSKGGKFILRIEDTDTSRTLPGSAEQIEKDLNWLSICPDESPQVNNKFGPYIQSKRSHIYEDHANMLIEKGFAYRCFCSVERLQKLKEESKFQSYDNKCRSLSTKDSYKMDEDGVPYCIRLKMSDAAVVIEDLVFGEMSLSLNKTEGDPVIVKSNGMASYHLANVVDDHLMQISHVFRGDQWLTSLPKHIHLYRSFGWQPPLYGHLPQMVNVLGKKLSKRENDFHVRELRRQMFAPEAVLNFIKLTGGGFEDIDMEKLYTLTELTEKFCVSKLNIQNTQLDMERLHSYNRIALQSNEIGKNVYSLREQLELQYGSEQVADFSNDFLEAVVSWGINRIHTIRELATDNFKYLFFDPVISKEQLLQFNLNCESVLRIALQYIYGIEESNFSEDAISTALKLANSKSGVKGANFWKILRLALCGIKTGPAVSEITNLLGKEKTLHRLNHAHDITRL